MKTCIKCDRIVLPDGVVSGAVILDGGKIIGIVSDAPQGIPCIDTTGGIVAPGMIDLHTHGGGGYSFTESTPEDIVRACNFHLSHGTTSIAPTVTTGPFDTMAEAVRNIHTAMQSKELKCNLIGAHMEGPYLSPAQCGAQAPDFITPPDPAQYNALLDETDGTIVRWTYAPEQDPEGEFCKLLRERGIIVSAGHTNATYTHMQTAIDSGCSLITHLYSCTSTVTRDHGFRSLGVIETAFLRDELTAEIIADGKHLPPELVRMIVKIKGVDKVAAVTDSLSIAGSTAARGVMSGVEYIVEDGVAKLTDRSAFAGSVATTDILLRVLVNDCGLSLPEAFTMLSDTPARIHKLSRGRIAEGYDADLIILDNSLTVTQVMVGGELI